MTPEERSRKLDMIRTLRTQEHIDGWRDGMRVRGREYFDGEAAALAEREREIKKGE
jgi:hypothetical protein